MKILVLGGKGQLGQALSMNPMAKKFSLVFASKKDLDITSSESIENIEYIKPDLIINCAAFTNVKEAEKEPDKAFQVNTVGASNIAKASAKFKIALVHISTDYVFSGPRSTLWKESDSPNPISVYGASKLEGEQLINEIWGENSIIIRTAWLYSPWAKNFAKTIIQKSFNGSAKLSVVSDQIGQPTSATEFAEKLFQIIERNIPRGTYHLTNSGETSWFEFANQIIYLSGKHDLQISPVTTKDLKEDNFRSKYTALSNQKIIDFGIEPMLHWHKALESTIGGIISQTGEEQRNRDVR